jgi:hypothetical protein
MLFGTLGRRWPIMDEKDDDKGGGGGGGGDKDKDVSEDKAIDKALKEKNNWREKAKEEERKRLELEAKLADREKEELKTKENFKELAEREKKRAEELEARLKQKDLDEERRFKESIVKKELKKNGIADDSVDTIMPLVKMDQVKYDPETKAVWGYEDQVKDLKTKLPTLFGTTGGQKPNQQPPKVTDQKRPAPTSSSGKPDWRANLKTPLSDAWKEQGVDTE